MGIIEILRYIIGLYIEQCSNIVHLSTYKGFPGGSVVENLPVMQETQVLSLGWKEPLEKSMAAHSSILAWRIPWTEEPGGLLSKGSHRVGLD